MSEDPMPYAPTPTEEERYRRREDERERWWEALCGRCGACCGVADGDPCENLTRDAGGRWACGIYENRFGIHRTVSGKEIRCVPIRQILHKSWPGDACCGYKKLRSTLVRPVWNDGPSDEG